jgi:hypothetical protein
MARTAAVACLLLALAASASAAGKGSHSPAPAPALDCISAAASLSDCLAYVTPGSTEKSPSKTCCGEVKTAVANPAVVDCLCSLAGSKNLGFPIDMKRVFKLPGACGSSNTVFDKCHSERRPRALSPPGLVSCLNFSMSRNFSIMPSPTNNFPSFCPATMPKL